MGFAVWGKGLVDEDWVLMMRREIRFKGWRIREGVVLHAGNGVVG